MRTELIYESRSFYRDSFRIQGYAFGTGRKAVCVVGSMRGNEYQQLYMASQLIRELKRTESEDRLTPGCEILVVPSANPSSMNIAKRFWPIDNTDINRMFPGYMEGETTQRIAGGIFARAQQYEYGIQFASSYMTGLYAPHISIMKTSLEYAELAAHFGMPYVILRNTRPYDTTTLNYNWQIWDTKAFSLYTTQTERIDRESALRGVQAVFAFLASLGLVQSVEKLPCGSADAAQAEAACRTASQENGNTDCIFAAGGADSVLPPRIIDDSHILSVRTPAAGLFEPAVSAGQAVRRGMLLARVLNPVDGGTLAHLYASADGIVFFLCGGPMIYEHTAVIKLIPQ